MRELIAYPRGAGARFLSDPRRRIRRAEKAAVPAARLGRQGRRLPAGRRRSRIQAGACGARSLTAGHRCPGARHRRGRVRLRAALHDGTGAVWAVDRELPGHPVHAGRYGDSDRGGASPGVSSRDQGGRQGLRPHEGGGHGQTFRFRYGDARDHRLRPAARRLRVHLRLPCRENDARCQDHSDLRGHQPDPAGGDRQGAAALSAEPQKPAPPPPPPPPVPPHQIAPYYRYPGPQAPQPGPADGRALAALLTGSIGLILALTAILFGATAYLFGIDYLLLGLLLGVPAMVLGSLGYFLGRSSRERSKESQGTMGGRSTASTGLAIGVAATAIGATVTVVAIVLYLVAVFGEPPV